MKLSDFQYDLPKELIAQKPLKERDSSRLMILDRASGKISEGVFRDIAGYVSPGDCLVMNDTRVVPVRLLGKRETGGRVEIFVLNPWEDNTVALVKPSKRIKEGEKVFLDSGHVVSVEGAVGAGRAVAFDAPLKDVLKEGHVPLPPYIERQDTKDDRHDYQTVYAEKDGATASPTAGLHFTKELIERLQARGAGMVRVTLHTGYGTFAPVKSENIEDHDMHSEYFEVTCAAASEINAAKASGKRIIAVGTTSARALESVSPEPGTVTAYKGETNLFIYPGYKFKIIDGLITNFHLPGSTLLMLVSAFAGREFVLEAYRKAVEKRYRFFSYGDAMLIS